jgi:hypothetical protein
MLWHQVVACFFGGAFLANFVPHFVTGVSGRPFHSPFAKPPFRGFSPPSVNILWGLFNLAVAYILLVVVGGFELQRVAHAAVSGAGFGLASIGIAGSIGRMQSMPV